MSTASVLDAEQRNQAAWASQDATVIEGVSVPLAGMDGGLAGIGGFFERSPAAVAEQQMAIKAQNRAAVSEPAAFDRYAGGRHEHWCAHFVSWLHAAAGRPLPDWRPPSPSYFPRHAGCNWLWDHLSKYGMTHNGMPRRNDIIFYKHPDPKYKSGHVGLVTEVKDGQVTTIEGNLSSSKGPDTVAKTVRPLTSSKIYGYARAYRGGVSPVLLIGAAALGTALLLSKTK